MNRISIVGRFVKDPELKVTKQDIPVCMCDIACKGKTKEDVDFFRCAFWREKAKLVSQYCHKGDVIAVSGYMNSYYYDKDGDKHLMWQCVVEELEFLGSGQKPVKTNPEDNDDFFPIADDEVFPF